MNRLFRMEFGAAGDQENTRFEIGSLREFEGAADLVELLAGNQGMAFQVNLVASGVRGDDPLLVQFLVGDRDRGSVLWHEDGAVFAAVDPSVEPCEHDIKFASLHGIELAEPAQTRLTPGTALQAVLVYLLTGTRPESLEWHELADD